MGNAWAARRRVCRDRAADSRSASCLGRGQCGEGIAADFAVRTCGSFSDRGRAWKKSATTSGGFDATDADGARLGTVLETAPASNSAIGFSGSSNLLIALDTRGLIVGLDVLSSGDTPEHVARVKSDPKFMRGFVGLTLDEAARRTNVDAVSGATLTSDAMAEGLRRRLGGALTASLKFPAPPTVGDVRALFPDAEEVEPDAGDPAVVRVRGPAHAALGWVLRTSPAADNTIGYQGPTDALVGFDPTGHVVGLAIHKSFDTDQYVGYVRDDDEFRKLFNGKSVESLAGLDLQAAGVEGVSGATMTSMAVARGLVLAAKGKLVHDRGRPATAAVANCAVLRLADVGTLCGNSRGDVDRFHESPRQQLARSHRLSIAGAGLFGSDQWGAAVSSSIGRLGAVGHPGRRLELDPADGRGTTDANHNAAKYLLLASLSAWRAAAACTAIRSAASDDPAALAHRHRADPGGVADLLSGRGADALAV